jgi:hypothetical protein
MRKQLLIGVLVLFLASALVLFGVSKLRAGGKPCCYARNVLAESIVSLLNFAELRMIKNPEAFDEEDIERNRGLIEDLHQSLRRAGYECEQEIPEMVFGESTASQVPVWSCELEGG